MELEGGKRLFIKLGFTDMRKQINGLSAMIQALRPEGPFDGSYFLFCGKTRRTLKILYWERNGFCLWSKRLERDLFPWPNNDDELAEFDRSMVLMLLRGIDIWKEHKEITFRSAG